MSIRICVHNGVGEFMSNYKMVEVGICLIKITYERIPMVHVDIQRGFVSLARAGKIGGGIGGSQIASIKKVNV